MLPPLCIGTSPLGSFMAAYGSGLTDADAYAVVEAALDSGIRFLDTSNGYGQAERRIGDVLKRRGLPEDYVLATKADPEGSDFSGERVMASFAESRERLGLERFDIFYLHDPERFDFDDLARPGGAFEAMRRIKETGGAASIGVAGGDLEMMNRCVDTGLFDVVLNHNRYTLLDRSADALIDRTLDAGALFVNAAPYASGLLAKGEGATYHYGAPSDEVTRQVDALRRVCAKFGVPLPALALRFSTRDPRISSTVVGASRVERIAELERNHALTIPDEIWDEVERVRRG